MSHWIDGGEILESVFARLREKRKFTVKDLKHELDLQLNDYGVEGLNSSEIHEEVNKATDILLKKVEFKEAITENTDSSENTDSPTCDTEKG